MFAVILLTVLTYFYLKNKSEMFNTIDGANNEIRMNEEISNYFLRRPTLPVNQAQTNIQDQIVIKIKLIKKLLNIDVNSLLFYH